jgi:hypothetical protein
MLHREKKEKDRERIKRLTNQRWRLRGGGGRSSPLRRQTHFSVSNRAHVAISLQNIGHISRHSANLSKNIILCLYGIFIIESLRNNIHNPYRPLVWYLSVLKNFTLCFYEGLHFFQTVPFVDPGGASYLFNYLLVIISQSQSDCLGSLGQPFFYVACCDYELVIVLLSRPVKKHSLVCKEFCVWNSAGP